MSMQRILLMTGFSMLLAQPALASGMIPPSNLLPPGYLPATQPAPLLTYSDSDASERSGMGEADLAPAMAPMELPLKPNAPVNDYVDIPALSPMPQSADKSVYTQGITTGPKAYNEGNFTFKAQ